MTDSYSVDEPPDDNEAFESLDEALDDEDGLLPGGGPEGDRDLDFQLVVDQAELEEAGAALDDPERISLLDGGIDDPDGSGPPAPRDDEAGWDVDPVWHPSSPSARDGVDGEAVSETDLIDGLPPEDDDEAALGLDMDQIPDDAPGLGGR